MVRFLLLLLADFQSYHNGAKFSTADNDQDGDDYRNCAQKYNGGWWFTTRLTYACDKVNLNANNSGTAKVPDGEGIHHYPWT
ncbi:MAG TPA: hypothetical protein EYQ87_06295, partial [Candidatus Nitrosopelagicus sp.]|nr:hypothetical protein [Candidatus Nitrosopelagicus sp.]